MALQGKTTLKGAIMTVQQKYQTKRLDCWPRLIELRQQLSDEMWTAHERGELLVVGGETGLTSLPAGLGKFHFFGGLGPNTARIYGDYELLTRCLYQAEVMGYDSWDLCGPLRVHLGAMALETLDQLPGGSHERPDFMFTERMCDQQAKGAQLVNELMNDVYKTSIPFFVIEAAPEPRVDYMVSQYAEFIAWMEKITGRKYQDELLIEATKNEWQTGVLWSRICELQKTIPAPLDLRTMFSLTTVIWQAGKHRSETIEFLQMVLDEVKDRVANKIAALGTERYRPCPDSTLPTQIWRRMYWLLRRFYGWTRYLGDPGRWHYESSSHPC
jgi:benzoyl-CoA reductase subunit B